MKRGLTVGLIAAAVVTWTADPLAARPYRWVNRDGVVTYSDQPPREPGTVYEANGVQKRVPPADELTRAPQPDYAGPQTGVGIPGPSARPPVFATEAPDPPRATTARERAALARLVGALRLRREAQRLAQIGHDAARRATWREPMRAAHWMTASARLSPERLAKIAETEAGRRIAAEPAAVVGEWLVSPAGTRLIDAMTEPMTPRMSADLRTFTSQLPDAPPSTSRVAIVRRLLKTIGLGPLAFDGSELVERRLRALVTGVRSETPVPSGYRPVSERSRHQLMVAALFRCRRISDAELRRAADFWESPAARAVAVGYREAVAAAVVTVTEPRMVAAR